MEGAETLLIDGRSAGQDLIDCLTGLRLVAPELGPELHDRLATLFPPIIKALQTSLAVVRNTAAKCLAELCEVITDEGMKRVVDDVVPLVGDTRKVAARQGAVEGIHREYETINRC